tara:strand:+ start:321 stop:599 length:279 start_codon:yes stop_codon:yes gene_type:complete
VVVEEVVDIQPLLLVMEDPAEVEHSLREVMVDLVIKKLDQLIPHPLRETMVEMVITHILMVPVVEVVELALPDKMDKMMQDQLQITSEALVE